MTSAINCTHLIFYKIQKKKRLLLSFLSFYWGSPCIHIKLWLFKPCWTCPHSFEFYGTPSIQARLFQTSSLPASLWILLIPIKPFWLRATDRNFEHTRTSVLVYSVYYNSQLRYLATSVTHNLKELSTVMPKLFIRISFSINILQGDTAILSCIYYYCLSDSQSRINPDIMFSSKTSPQLCKCKRTLISIQ